MTTRKVSDPITDANCVLRIGKYRRESMQTEITKLYGMTATFLTTDVRYVPPMRKEIDYVPQIPEPPAGELAPPAKPSAIIAKLQCRQ